MVAAMHQVLALALSAGSVPEGAPPHPVAAAVEDTRDEIVVTGFNKPYKLTGKQLATALRVFRKYRPVYAPRGHLLFAVSRKGASRNRDPLRLSLRSGDSVIPIALDAASRFALPELPDKNWELVANRGSGAIRIQPLVLSPGATESDRSLGDMRLQCEVTWAAFVKPELPLIVRGLAAAVNACRTRNVALLQQVDKRITSAEVVSGLSSTPIKLQRAGMSYQYPGSDKHLPNEARVRFHYN